VTNEINEEREANAIVMRGLDPRIHPFAKTMDCRVKPGNVDNIRGIFPLS
jgi:hypothetical protein